MCSSSSFLPGRLFVSGFDPAITHADLRQLFDVIGPVQDCFFSRRGHHTFAFVQFVDPEHATAALCPSNKWVLGSNILRVSRAFPKKEEEKKKDDDDDETSSTIINPIQSSLQQNIDIWVGNLPPSTQDDELREYFEFFGPIVSVDIKRVKGPRAHAFITFDCVQSAYECLDPHIPYSFHDRYLEVRLSRTQTTTIPPPPYPEYGYFSVTEQCYFVVYSHAGTMYVQRTPLYVPNLSTIGAEVR